MKYIKSFDDFINESQINEMGMAVRNANVQAQMDNIMSKYNLVLNPETGRYDCNGDVKVSADLVSSDGKFIIQFGVVGGHFDCSSNKLTSLEGAPQEVGGDFFCYCNKLRSRECVRESISVLFYCYYKLA